MQKWQYGLAVYMRKERGQMEAVIEVTSGTLPMEGFSKGDLLHLDVFLRKAGALGWELTTVCEPFPAGMTLVEHGKDDEPDRPYIVANSGEIQWFIFKRPQI